MKSVSFVIPVYNENKRIKKTFDALKEGFSFNGIKLEKIIFVDDGSQDPTFTRIQLEKKALEKATNAKVELIAYTKNKGKGYAIREGLKASDSDYTLFFDVDMSTPLSEFTKFLPKIKEGVDVIIGTRKNGHSTVVHHQPLYRELLGRCFTLLSQIILHTWVTDFTCGFKAFSRESKNEIVKHTLIERWGYDAELLYLARIYGYSMVEVPVVWSHDDRSKVNLLKDVPKTLLDLTYLRLYHSVFKPFFIKGPSYVVGLAQKLS
jgi:dolichyl-phosphate beta-glucosyltransferase